MNDPRPHAAGGVLVAFGALAGAATGFAFGQATAGFLIGFAAGSLAAIAIWWRDRNRR